MGVRSLLNLVSDACQEIGIVAPTQVIGNTNLQVAQLLALARREGKSQYQRGMPLDGWQALRTEYQFTLQSTGLVAANYTQGSNTITLLSAPATTPQVGWVISNSGGSNATAFTYPTTITAIDGTGLIITVSTAASSSNTNVNIAFGQDTYLFPSDVDHTIPQTFWDRSFRWQLLGPVDPQEWQVLKSGISPTGPRRRFRIFGGNLVIDPVPYASATLVYEYYSRNWCQSAAGVPQSEWTEDTDTFRLDDDAMTLGLIWRFKRSKGLDYDEEREQYERRIEVVAAQNAAERSLPLNASASGVRLLNNNNTPDTGFGS